MSRSPRRSPPAAARDRRDESPPFPRSTDEDKFNKFAREARDQDRQFREKGINVPIRDEGELRKVWKELDGRDKKVAAYHSRYAAELAGLRPPRYRLGKLPTAAPEIAPELDPDLVPFNEERPQRIGPRQIVRDFFKGGQ